MTMLLSSVAANMQVPLNRGTERPCATYDRTCRALIRGLLKHFIAARAHLVRLRKALRQRRRVAVAFDEVFGRLTGAAIDRGSGSAPCENRDCQTWNKSHRRFPELLLCIRVSASPEGSANDRAGEPWLMALKIPTKG
jgi:hypothetical protein